MKRLIQLAFLWVWWLAFFLIGRGRDINGVADHVLKGRK